MRERTIVHPTRSTFCYPHRSVTPSNRQRATPPASLLTPCLIALGYSLLHLLTASRYGYFRDALYYIACSQHLDWGYVDQPPAIVFIAWIARHTLGLSLPALLLWPALAGAARIVLTAAFARELGAGRFGVVLAAVLAAVPGVWQVIDHQFAMNAFEPLFWTGCAYVALRMIKTGNPRLWLAFGAIAGLGLENKYAIAAFAGALLAGLPDEQLAALLRAAQRVVLGLGPAREGVDEVRR